MRAGYRPEACCALPRIPQAALETLEDRLVDRLVWPGRPPMARPPSSPARRAKNRPQPRRARDRRADRAAFASKAGCLSQRGPRGNIGLIPSRITGLGPIWRERVAQTELTRRIETIHRPYHLALEAALGHARTRFGAAILLDCHSMPPRPRSEGGGAAAATVIFGDRHGTTTTPDLLDAAVTAAGALGYRTACNAPYAGGYIVGRHGRPGTGVHALQIEIDRSLYLDEDLRTPGPGFEGVARLIASVAHALESRLLRADQALAAE